MKALNRPLMLLSALLSLNCGLNGQQSSAVETPQQASTNFEKQASDSQTPQDMMQIIGELPSCSFLHQQLVAGIYGKGTMQPYMEDMRREGVKKAVFVVHAHWGGKQPQDPALLTSLYFDSYDGPNGQIIQPERLESIRKSGLERLLNEFVLAKSQTLPIYNGPDGGPLKRGTPIYSYVRLFDNPRVIAIPNRFMRSNPQLSELSMAVLTGDALQVKQLTQAHKPSSKELNDLLHSAVMNSFDSSQIIGILVSAGADVNAGLKDGTPILISAIGQPCNLKALLENGATADVHDHWHRSALEVAQVGHQIESARIIEKALSHP